MIRLIANFIDDQFTYTLAGRDGVLFSASDSIDVAERMLQLGIDDPLHLIEAARQWGEVEIREEEADRPR